jgi:hypothetical protein
VKTFLRIVGTLCTMCCLAAGLHSVAAHHATTMFDFSKTVTITGTVLEFRWVNPHVSLLVNGAVNEGEPPAPWLLEMSSPGNLVRVSGWSRTTVKPGDRVRVDMAPLRDESAKGGILKKLILLDTGETFTANIREPQERPGLE